MNIFENLENLNVSEECFDEIMGIVEEVVNENVWATVMKKYGEPEWKNGKPKNKAAELFNKVQKNYWDNERTEKKNYKTASPYDELQAEVPSFELRREPEISAKLAKTKSIKKHYSKGIDDVLNNYKKSNQGRSQGNFKKLSENVDDYTKKV